MESLLKAVAACDAERDARRWYVLDTYDCFDSFNTAVEAAALAETLQRDGLTGIHIAYMSKSEANHYITTGIFPFGK